MQILKAAFIALLVVSITACIPDFEGGDASFRPGVVISGDGEGITKGVVGGSIAASVPVASPDPSTNPGVTPTATPTRIPVIPPAYEEYRGPAVTAQVRVFRPAGAYEDRKEIVTCRSGGQGRLDQVNCTPALGLRGGCYAVIPPDDTVICDADPFERPGGTRRYLLQALPNVPVIPDLSTLATFTSEPQWAELATGARCSMKLGGTRYLVFLGGDRPIASSYYCGVPLAQGTGYDETQSGYAVDLTGKDGPVIRWVDGRWLVDLAIPTGTATPVGWRVIRNVPVAVIWR